MRHLEDVFNIFRINVHEWVRCSMADNAPVKKTLERLLDVPHVVCMSRKLIPVVKAMAELDGDLEELIESIHGTMLSYKKKLTHRSMQRNLTHLAPVLRNATWWSSKHEMLKRFNEIRSELLEVAATENSDVGSVGNLSFKRKAERYGRILREINSVTLLLQKKGATLAYFRSAVDAVLNDIRKYCMNK